MKKILCLVVSLVMLASFANAGEVRTKIDARIAEFVAAWNSGNHEGVLALYDKGFMVIPDRAEPVVDREAYGKQLASEVKEYTNIKYETATLKVHGDYAYEIGVGSYEYKGEDGKVTTGKDDYLVVWKKDDKGVWNYHIDAWWDTNSDAANTKAVRAKIDARIAEFIATWKKGDAEGVLAFYDKGFILVSDMEEPLLDRDAWGKQLASEVKELAILKHETASLKVHGDYAYEIGVGTYASKDEDGNAGDAAGKYDYLFVWKKDDKGVWNIHIDIWWGPNSEE